MKDKKITAKERIAKLEVDSAYRKEIFKGLLAHLTKGYSLDCYAPLSAERIHEYLQRYPNEFSCEELQETIRQAKTNWEDIGTRQSNGSCLGNSRSWVYNMINRYNWTDKVKVETKGEQQVNVNIVSYAKSAKPKLS